MALFCGGGGAVSAGFGGGGGGGAVCVEDVVLQVPGERKVLSRGWYANLCLVAKYLSPGCV